MDMLTPIESTTKVLAFDYASLPEALAETQRQRAERIASIYRRTVEAAGEIGHELLAAQEELEHGTFLRWVQDGLGLSKSSAYRFMDIARSFGEKLPTVGNLPMTVVHKLAERSTPEPVRAAVLRRIEAGETIKTDAILDEVREAKDKAKKEAAAEREKVRRAALTPERREEEDLLKARSEKGAAARERKEERERAERDAVERQRNDEAARGATWLVERLGADDAAAFFARFDNGYMTHRVAAMARKLADVRRSTDVPPTDLSITLIDRRGHLSDFHRLTTEERQQVEAEATRIRDGGAIEPMPVVRQPGARELYDLVEGGIQLRALVDVLRRETVPVRIVPPAAPLSGLPGDV